MKLVIQTQFVENYGAHDWDGQGECPQHWKAKGGETYIVEGVSVDSAMSEGYYDALYSLVSEKSEYFQEYVIGSDLVDDADFDLSNHVEDWEKPVFIKPVGDKFVATKEHYMEGYPSRTWILGE